MKPDCLSPEQWTAVLTIYGRVDNARRSLARRMGHGFLQCGNCQRRETLNARLVDKYLREGWPKCCEGTAAGGTMNYYSSQAQFEKERLAIGVR